MSGAAAAAGGGRGGGARVVAQPRVSQGPQQGRGDLSEARGRSAEIAGELQEGRCVPARQGADPALRAASESKFDRRRAQKRRATLTHPRSFNSSHSTVLIQQ